MGRAPSEDWTQATLAALRAAGRRDGGARRAIVELLGRESCCVSAQTIFDKLRAQGRRVGIASIYRTLEQLGSDGYVQRIDFGPESARAYAAVLRGAKTIVFNGPMGVYEKAAYQNGTRVVGEAIADATRHGATSVVGGGDAAAAAHALGFADAMTHVSTGGGATLEFLEGKTLPGVAALERP